MKENELQASLSRLRAELKRLEFGDPAARQQVEQLLAQIESHVETVGGVQQRNTLVANISETIRRFEVEHPAFTAYLNEIAAALG